MTTSARELQARNHQVAFLYQSEAAGLPCIPGPENDQISWAGGAKSARPKRRVTMTIISGPVKPVDCHPDVSRPMAEFSASLGGFFEPGLRPWSVSNGTGKEVPIEQGHRKAVFWLVSLAALISFLVGILCLMESVAPRTADAEQLDLAAEGAPSHVEVTIGEAIRALSVRH